MDIADLPSLFYQLPAPMGVYGPLSPLTHGVKNLKTPPSRFRLDIIKFISIYNIPVRKDDKVYFPEVFWPIMHSVLGSNNKTLITNKFAKIVFKDIT